MEEVEYFDFKAKKILKEKIFGHAALSFFYPTKRGFKALIGSLLCTLYSRIPFFSAFYGFLQKLPSSRKKVEPFVKTYDVDASEFKKDLAQFSSFNDFFIRELQKDARPIDPDPQSFVAPCDGRFLCFENIGQMERFYVKGQSFSVEQFLNDRGLAHTYQEAPALFARLCPVDYHRFHFPCDGTPKAPRLINGPLFSVNPIALRKNLAYLWENKRYLMEFDTEKFGKVLYVAIGASNVGSVSFTYKTYHPVYKGDECGYFSFGGSSLLLLFENQDVKFDETLLNYSLKGIETRCLLGDKLAVF